MFGCLAMGCVDALFVNVYFSLLLLYKFWLCDMSELCFVISDLSLELYAYIGDFFLALVNHLLQVEYIGR